MPKVDFPEGSSPFFNPAAYTLAQADARKAKEKGAVKRVPFKALIDGVQGEEAAEAAAAKEYEPSEEALRTLMDRVHENGEELKGSPSMETIMKYKAAVRDFLHYVVENGYTVEERTSGNNILKRKKFTLIQVVDRKLEQLAAGILAGQRSQLDILARVDEIAGLLVDLTR